ncbi:unnamed protein product [Caenorhabditis auriculariae]|uniref:Uncharacterized protein n=1 Tax=Caenorhabditis auriculariae TaxID=2777116 RepID=A0A8S1HNP8_9PELO|nr:unnamed protein product [Caenorhabditis auriculariae]
MEGCGRMTQCFGAAGQTTVGGQTAPLDPSKTTLGTSGGMGRRGQWNERAGLVEWRGNSSLDLGTRVRIPAKHLPPNLQRLLEYSAGCGRHQRSIWWRPFPGALLQEFMFFGGKGARTPRKTFFFEQLQVWPRSDASFGVTPGFQLGKTLQNIAISQVCRVETTKSL